MPKKKLKQHRERKTSFHQRKKPICNANDSYQSHCSGKIYDGSSKNRHASHVSRALVEKSDNEISRIRKIPCLNRADKMKKKRKIKHYNLKKKCENHSMRSKK